MEENIEEVEREGDTILCGEESGWRDRIGLLRSVFSCVKTQANSGEGEWMCGCV
jgi:hypothetical protein